MNELPGDAELIRARATTWRRVALGIYAGGLTVGTHWPRLELGDPRHPPDKMLHFLCFGGLAVLLHQARFFRLNLVLIVVAIVWIVFDETTQAIPGLGRSFSVEDIAASAMGAIVATAICWATRPVGGPAARVRRARFDLCLDRLLSSPTNWMAIATGLALGAMIGVPTGILIDAMWDDPTPFQAGVIGGLLGGATVGGALLLLGVRHEERRAIARGDWVELPVAGWPDVIRACARPIAGGCAILLSLTIVWGLGVVLRRDWALVAEIQRWFDSLSKGMIGVIDAAVIGLIGAGTIDRCRARLAAVVDRADQRCLQCGQDLRATPVIERTGRCGECGSFFIRAS
ncbi:MAG: VanZ family protein [Phycisphaerales bacterium]